MCGGGGGERERVCAFIGVCGQVWEKESVLNKEDHAFSNSQNEEGEKKGKNKRKRDCATRKITVSEHDKTDVTNNKKGWKKRTILIIN